MSDIRRFFDSGKKARASADTSGGSSALSDLREQATRRSPRKTPQKSAPVAPPPTSASKKRSQRKIVSMEIEDSDGEGENPLPKSVRQEAAKASATASRKKKPVILSDSEDEPPILVRNSPTPSPKKRNTKRGRIESDEDSPAKKKPSPKKGKPTVVPAATAKASKVVGVEEDEFVTDSEDEFREVKKTKKPASKQTKTVGKPKEKEVTGKPIKKVDSNVVPGKTVVTTTGTADSKKGATSTSPSQKENTPKKAPVVKPKPAPPPKPVNLAVTAPKADLDCLVPWVDKYKPRSLQQLVGQNGEKSPMNKLTQWLKDWAKNNLGDGGKTKKARPPPWMAGQDGSAYKAALLSGAPGIGKTTCAIMVCDLLGFQYVEMNASDVRSKKQLDGKVTELTGTHQIDEYFGRQRTSQSDVKHVLIMDEVDGMSGNEDRAGLAELIAIIKDTKIPILCICNDRSHPKMRTLVNYCFDLRFPKPRVEQIRSRVMTIAVQEKIKMTKDEIDQLIELSNHDVRQTIYNLQMRAALPSHKIQQKDVTMGPFDAARKLLSRSSSLAEKQEMFFVDYGIMPLFVQENYLNLHNDQRDSMDSLERMRRAADMISYGDTIDRTIRSTGAWKLLNEQAMLGAALPAMEMDGYMRGMITFPAWLGKNSSAMKKQRLAKQLVHHAHLRISADAQSLVTDYVPALRERLTRPLIEKEAAGVSEVVETMDVYDLIKDDMEAIAELAVWPGRKDPAAVIQSKTKSALTRALNKVSRMLPYSLEDVAKGKKRGGGGGVEDLDIEIDEEGNVIEKGGDGGESGEEEEGEEKKESGEGAGGGGKVGGASRGGATAGRGGSRGRGASTRGAARGGGGAKRGRGAK